MRLERVRTIDRARLAWGTLLATLLVVVAWDFLAATTFFGDDHLFLTYARHAPHPFAALVADQHGGEYYRPLPMALWWLLVKIGGEQWTARVYDATQILEPGQKVQVIDIKGATALVWRQP